jgi:hypothetical protein
MVPPIHRWLLEVSGQERVEHLWARRACLLTTLTAGTGRNNVRLPCLHRVT